MPVLRPVDPPPPPSSLEAFRAEHHTLYLLWLNSGERLSSYLHSRGLGPPPPPEPQPRVEKQRFPSTPLTVMPQQVVIPMNATFSPLSAPSFSQSQPTEPQIFSQPTQPLAPKLAPPAPPPAAPAPAATASRNWLSQHAAKQQQLKATVSGASSSGGIASAHAADKRLKPTGKRKIAALATKLKESARSVAEMLRPASQSELDAIDAHVGPISLIFHFADGSSTAFPRDVLGRDERFDPWREAAAVGVSLLATARPASAASAASAATGASSLQPPPQPQSKPLMSSGLSLVGGRPLNQQLSAGLSAPSSCSSSAQPPEQPERCVHWLLPARLRQRPGTPCDPTEGDAAHEAACEAGWHLLWALLCDGQRKQPSTLVVPNAKQAIRTLATLCEHMHLGGDAMWPALTRWLDPIMIGWLLEPDATEESLLLPQLHAKYATATGAAGEEPEPGDDIRADLKCCFEVTLAMHARLRTVLPQDVWRSITRREMRVVELLAAMELNGLPM